MRKNIKKKPEWDIRVRPNKKSKSNKKKIRTSLYYFNLGTAIAIGIVGIIVILFVFLFTQENKPSIKKIVPSTASAKETISIYGKNLGEKSLGYIQIGSLIIPNDQIVSWTSKQINLIVPEFNSGYLRVVSHGQSSNKVYLFHSSDQQQEKKADTFLSLPYILSKKVSTQVGQVISIKGNNLNLVQKEVHIPSYRFVHNHLQVNYRLLDKKNIQYWGNNQIQIKIPEGIYSGYIFFGKTNQKHLLYCDLLVHYPNGMPMFSSARVWKLKQKEAFKVERVVQKDNGVAVWVPSIVEDSLQKYTQALHFLSDPPQGRWHNLLLWMKSPLKAKDQWIWEAKYTVERIQYSYEKPQSAHFPFIPWDQWPEIPIEWQLNDQQKNLLFQLSLPHDLYLSAKKIYQTFLQQFHVQLSPSLTRQDMNDKQIYNSQALAFFLTQVFNHYRIPSRILSGFIVQNQQLKRHYWNQIYLPTVGWMPIDVSLALAGVLLDQTSSLNAQTYYFGHMDNRHICFSYQYEKVKDFWPNNTKVVISNPYGLQDFYIASKGVYYSTDWTVDLER